MPRQGSALVASAAVLAAALAGAAVTAYGCSEHYPDQLVQAQAGDAGDAAADGAASAALEAAPPALVPAAERLDASSSVLAYDAARTGVWVANSDVGTVSFVDLTTMAVTSEVGVGADITSVALSPDGAWLAAVDRKGAQVALIDAAAKVVRRTLAVGTRPRAAVWDAWNPRWLYVSQEDADAVTVIDRTAGAVVTTLPAGEKPSGLAVSRLRSELAVLHRGNGSIVVLDVSSYSGSGAGDGGGGKLAEIDLAAQPENDDPTQPQGQPFAVESLAWLSDGVTAWVPHELLTLRQPFAFQETLFPAVSVVDFSRRAEVASDPNDPNSVVAGRKLLFGAINVLDAMGNTEIVSQPCAAAVNPAGSAAYALACASEDLIVFDSLSGSAVDLLRGLPGAHPTGIVVDPTGARGYVYAEQSHSLITLDLAGGNPLGHVAVVGAPLVTVHTDPVDPALRAGETSFFSANSSKGSLATTGNDWMSCGGCHLDGFESSNRAFFSLLVPPDPTNNAQIGHENLSDGFASASGPDLATFRPHDLLVALTDQGGLAPDRSGADRTGAIDPSAPTAEATALAQSLARMVARDLPSGSSWLVNDGAAPDAVDDTSFCGNCHPNEYNAWQASAHAHAAVDGMVRFCSGLEAQTNGAPTQRLCAGCHDPVSLRGGDATLASGRGVTCLGCHENVRTIRAGGNGDLEAVTYDWTIDHKARASADLALLKQPQFCAGCHEQFTPGTAVSTITTYEEWQASKFGTTAPLPCTGCHMPPVTGSSGASGIVGDSGAPALYDHAFVGGNVYLATAFADAGADPGGDFLARTTASLQSAMTIAATEGAGVVSVTVSNKGAGRSFPTGVTDIREPWVELQAVDGSGNVVARYGGPGEGGLLPADAARFGIDIAAGSAADAGAVLLLHQLSETTRIPFDRRVPASGSVTVTLPIPTTIPAGTTLRAALLYHNVRTTYYRAATGDSTGTSPEVVMTTAPVE